MGIACFSRNSMVELAGDRYMLFRKVRGDVWQLERISDRSIIEREQSALYRALSKGTLRFVTAPAPPGKLERVELTAPEKDLIKVRRAYVVAVENLPNTKRAMEESITAVWQVTHSPKAKPSWTTVYRWKCAYRTFGHDGRALLNSTKERAWREKKYGPIVLALCDQAIDECYMRLERGTTEDAYELAKLKASTEQHRLDEQYKKSPETFPQHPVLNLPTRRLIKRLIDDIPAFDKHAARFGHMAAIVKFRSVMGKDLATEPLELFELDHTLLDLFVVDDEHGLPWGRPYVTAVIDCYTRCIVGLYIGSVPPSGLSVALCLKDAFLPIDYRDMYPTIKHASPFGVCWRVRVDNGLEMHGTQLEEACFQMGVTIAYAPRKRPWLKALIERFFGTLNEEIAHVTRGTTFRNVIEKGDYNPEGFAVVRLSVLRKGIRKWIADVYHQRPHRSLGVPPMQMWTDSIRPDQVRVPDDAKALDVVMGRPYCRRLTHKGIEFANLRYNSKELTDLRYREGADLDVSIRVNEEDIGYIWAIWNKSEVFEVPALNSEYAAGLTMYQHSKIQEHCRKCNIPDDEMGWIQAKEDVRQLFRSESRATKALRRNAKRFNDKGEKENMGEMPEKPESVNNSARIDSSSGSTTAVKDIEEGLPAELDSVIIKGRNE
jgi:putative transposase